MLGRYTALDVERFDGIAAREQGPFVPTSSVGAVGRYALHHRIAAGGMASVHLGRLQGEGGFARIVAIKRLHPHLSQDPAFVSMFLDEARLVARIRHPNVVPTLDVVAAEGEMLLVMEYVPGESLARLAQAMASRGEPVPPRLAAAIVCGALHGLHAAHEAHDEHGAPLHIVHRDVSPQNILVGTDGIARLLDFGVAKARSRLSETRDGELKGKLAYMAPEQLHDRPLDRKTDVYAAGVVLWEVLTGQRFHGDASEASIVERVLYGTVAPPTSVIPSLPPAIDAVVLQALARDPDARHATARDMADAVEAVLGIASMSDVSAWVHDVAGAELARRAALVAQVESSATGSQRAITFDTQTAAADDTLAEGRPSHMGAAATDLASYPGGRIARLPRFAIAVTGAAMLVGSFFVVRSLAAGSSPVAQPLPEPAPPAALASSSPLPTLATSATAPPVNDVPETLAPVASTPATAGSGSIKTRAAATVRRPKTGKERGPSGLPADLPSERE